MSLLSPERLSVLIAPGAVQAIHTKGWKAPIASLHTVAVQDPSVDNWSGRVDALATLLEKINPQEARIVIADRLVRYFPLAWNQDIRSVSEELAFAQIEFESTYGDNSAADWTFTISRERPGVSRLVCAMPTSLLTGIKATLEERKIRLTSVRPNLCAVMNATRKELGKHGWFLNLEAGRLTVMRWDAGGCRWVGTSRCESDGLEHVMAVLERQMYISGTEKTQDGNPVPVYVANPLLQLATASTVNGLPVKVMGLPARALNKIRQSPYERISESAALPLYSAALMGAML